MLTHDDIFTQKPLADTQSYSYVRVYMKTWKRFILGFSQPLAKLNVVYMQIDICWLTVIAHKRSARLDI